MKDEYDFSNAERGRFYRKHAKFSLPIYLDGKVLEKLTTLATSRGIEVDELANKLLERDVEELRSS